MSRLATLAAVAVPLLTLLSVLWVLTAGAQQPAARPATGLGPVDFHTSCRPETHADFNRGVSLLHSFWYEEALQTFQKVLAADPGCAMAIVSEARSVRAAEVDPRYPSYYGVVEARFPALYAIETHDWAMAGHLASVADGNAQSQALTLLAQVTAATYLHDAGAADTALHALEELAHKDPPPPAGSLRESIKAEIRAWAALAHGDLKGAKGLMSPVVASQARLGKGEVELPAGEMLADMLLLSGRPGEALRAYRRSLRSDPNRFNALLGAGAAAEQAGELPLAGRYYRAVLANCPEASGAARQQLAHPAAILGAQRRGRP